MAFQPQSYAEALQKAQSRPQKARTLLRSRTPLKLAQKPITRKPKAVKKKAKKKKLTDGQLKKKVWKEFSRFIRTRGADAEGFNGCYTCDVRLHWKSLEAGHLVPGRTNGVLFDERSVNPQCRRCNGHFRGNIIVYYPKMVGIFGQEVVDEIVAQKDITHKWQADELLTLLAKYKGLNDSNVLLKENPNGSQTNSAV